jgi:hypothetical protein
MAPSKANRPRFTLATDELTVTTQSVSGSRVKPV